MSSREGQGGVTREAVWAAAEQIDASGASVTLDAVRDALGGGSFSTITPLVRAWKTERRNKRQVTIEPAPSGLVQKGEAFMSAIWQNATELAAARYDVERQGLEQAIADAEAGAAELAEIASTARDERDELRRQVDALSSQVAEAGSALDSMRADLSQCRAAEAERARINGELEADLRARAALVAELEATVASLRDELATSRTEAGRQQGRADAVEAQNRELLAKLRV